MPLGILFQPTCRIKQRGAQARALRPYSPSALLPCSVAPQQGQGRKFLATLGGAAAAWPLARRREAKLLPGRGVKLPCLSARSQSLVDVAFRADLALPPLSSQVAKSDGTVAVCVSLTHSMTGMSKARVRLCVRPRCISDRAPLTDCPLYVWSVTALRPWRLAPPPPGPLAFQAFSVAALGSHAIARTHVISKPCVGVRSSWWPKARVHIHGVPTGAA